MRNDSLAQRKDLSEVFKKHSWISPLNEKNSKANMPVGSLMPNKVAVEDASSIVVPDGTTNYGGLFARNRFVSSGYNNDELDFRKTGKIHLQGSLVDSIII